ncbi:MAG TPA: cytochrome c oxidase subunit II [Anaerolineales bacterium]|nr:cytochrome c oxidase subunit II [Anaerolineales bacterium]
MKHIFIIAILVIASTFAIHTGLSSIGLLPAQASAQAVSIDQLFGIYTWAIAFVFSLIVVILLYSLVVFRRRKGETGEGAHIEGNTNLEIAWTVVPLLAVFYLAYLGGKSLGETRRVDPSAMVVKVVAGQWYWQFQYPDYGFGSGDLYLPVGKQVDLQMTSNDVIHSFFVPEFRLKQDILPGRTVDLRVTPTVIGSYKVSCAQLCGTNHAYMIANVVVVSQADFQAWVTKQLATASQDPALHGLQLVQQFGCAVCHSVDGSKKVGPTWQHLYESSVTLADGTKVTADDKYISDSIINPNLQIVKGFSPNVMPQTFGQTLDDSQIQAIIAYIESLK